ncbi:MAG: transcriptional regulator [Candidatus Heimdallarchaeota archaeon]
MNSKAFSLLRLILISNLVKYREDGISFRELKAGLDVTDGAIYSNLKALKEMGFIEEEPVEFGNKTLALYKITRIGIEEWKKIENWLKQFIDFMRIDEDD